jgi:uncharacterized NAD(P)/FAD-binding protein YdhS
MRRPVVAMVGGGASATLTAVHLLRDRAWAPEIVLIDRHGRHGLGQAYATTDPGHLLNACAAKMSALPDDPEHLLRWAGAEGWPGSGGDYLPRAMYGRYLRGMLHESAAGPGRLTELSGTVVALAPTGDLGPSGWNDGSPDAGGWRLRLADGRELAADAVVLATGNPAPAAWPWAPDDPRYVADPWAPGALDAIGDGAPVLVAGTGLTMVDVATTVTARHPDAVVYAVSRHGLLPEPHRCPAPPPADIRLPDGPLSLSRLVRTVRRAIDDNGGEWQGVVDALRPHVPRLWEELPLPDKRRFLTSLSRHWEVCRHRIPPATADRIADLRATGRLRILRGSIRSVTARPEYLAVGLDGAEIPVGWLVNGTGPGTGRDPLLNTLLNAGIARLDPLGLGLEADAAGAMIDAAGRPQERLFTLGPTLRGLRYETTAVPEIRAQAVRLAAHLTERLTPYAVPRAL